MIPTPEHFILRQLDFSFRGASMLTDTTDDSALTKQRIREQAHENRKNQQNKDELSSGICAKFMALRSTRPRGRCCSTSTSGPRSARGTTWPRRSRTARRSSCRGANPEGELELFWLQDMSDLATGMYKILEPREELRIVPERQVNPQAIDLIMVPGVAFDREGGRTGHGKGYYDKLLQHARRDTPLVALAFECQLFPKIPMHAHDIFMDNVITESAVYTGRGRR